LTISGHTDTGSRKINRCLFQRAKVQTYLVKKDFINRTSLVGMNAQPIADNATKR
jgi:hypothetical protein